MAEEKTEEKHSQTVEPLRDTESKQRDDNGGFDTIAELSRLRQKSYNSMMTDNQFDREFIVGIGNDNFLYDKMAKSWHYHFVLEQDYILWKYVSLNKPPSKLAFIFEEEMSLQPAEAMNEDGEVTEVSYMLSGVNVDDSFFVGTKQNDTKQENIFEVSGFRYFKAIECQYFYMRFQKSKQFVFYASHYLCGINYLKLVDDRGREYVFGKKEPQENEVSFHDEPMNMTNIEDATPTPHSYVSHVIQETGKLYITGILRSKYGILALQVADLIEEHSFGDSLFYAYRLLKNQGVHSVEYDQHKHPIDYQDDPKSKFRRIVSYYSLDAEYPIYFENFVCCENAEILKLFNLCCEYAIRDDNPSYNIMPEFLGVIEECFDGDMAVMHSIMSIERLLNDIIQTNFIKYRNKVGLKNCYFDPDDFTVLLGEENLFKYVLKIKRYWTVLYESAKFCKRLIKYTPNINAYTLSYLDGSPINRMRSIIVFLVQMLLFYNLVISLTDADIIDWQQQWEDYRAEFLVFAVFLGVALIFLVRKQITGYFEFRKVFMMTLRTMTMDIWLSAVINLGMSVLLIPLSCIIIVYSDNSLELVLNSVAALFVLELDDEVVDLALNDEKSIYLEYINQYILVANLVNDASLNNYNRLITRNWHYNFVYKINTKEMTIDFDPDVDVEKSALARLDLRSGEFSPFVSDDEVTTMKKNYVSFRLVNESMAHIRLCTRNSHEEPYWEIIIDLHYRIIRRRIEKDSQKFARLATEEYEEGTKPLPCFGTWFHIRWDNSPGGHLEYYYNKVDFKPTLDSPNTVLLQRYPYREFVEKECDVCPLGTYHPLCYLQIYAFAKTAKINFLE
eukprot:CAMPEP_0197031464 /NCGR_PEP_ID=MMETSP1384-20130603/10460_1 /TAXON_ID=29189 /ORGANISM="Ammonia sp." /LENGTH=842 /DNA_ID=CAMNT_0042460997 /DNA_START=56 /DNA_END=2584 /DNA_ORIENTATION=+